MAQAKLELRNVRFAYPGGPEVIRGLSLSFAEGRSTCVVGANGAGKSTLLLLLLGVLRPTGGELVLDGAVVTDRDLPLLRRKAGLTFQNPDDQLFMATVGEDVAFGPRNGGLGEEEVEARVAEALAQVGAEGLRERPPFRISGGEKRMAAIAAVLAMRPEILVMDEPTASLDPMARRRMIHLLRGFAHTKIITSHDLDMALEVCDWAVILKDGVVAAEGPAGEVLSDAGLLESCGLELPLTLQGCPRYGGKL